MTTQALASETMINLAWRRFNRHKIALICAMVLIVMALASFAAPLFEMILGVDANLVNLYERFAGSSLKHPLGTDELGRDVLVRLLYGGQVSLMVGLTAALAAAVFGTLIGLMAGYYGGRFDAFLMRTTDAVIALPLLPLLIVLAALDLRKLGFSTEFIESENISLYRIIVIVALVGWTTVARLVRGRTLTVRERDFVLAARSQGASAARIMLVHILPNVVSTDHRRDHTIDRQCHLAGIRLELFRPRHPTADRKLGKPADQCPGAHLAGASLGDLSRANDLLNCHVL